ncbi:phosphate starvation-inducible protein PhoH [Helicobacter sp. MIT 11-5569]|uniref:PhoH family protein n=1 Tax=Helicobacter sp. MIT 11-5569 TaxID=1548151 RepID=UPI0010FCEDB5|nr:PhoH family protein [Helicobacter sp. MIT 11-5569]TLD85104.1 phosphate starvation-inducible protein PhoH [Helicobacter sp. MIT 11-5569]
MKKSYLIDTSIILDDVENLFFLHQNGENAIFICDVTLSELDKKKDFNNETGFFAREFFRNILSDCACVSDFKALENDKIHTLFFNANHQQIPLQIIHRPIYKTKFQDYGLNDARILEIAKDYNLVLLTNDISLKVYALSLSVQSQSLMRDRIENPQDIDFLSHFSVHKNAIKANVEKEKDFSGLKNWSLIAIDELDNTESSLYQTGKKHYGIKLDNTFEKLDFDALLEEYVFYVKPMNLEQKFLYALLTHPKNKITICSGATGSGKTLIALQAGLHLLKKGVVSGIVYLRNTVTANDKEAELGFRKGDESQKLNYFMYPLFSAINFMITKMQKESLAKRIEYRGEANSIESKEATEYFIAKHNIEVMDIAHARGVSIAKKFVIFDEAQNASNATIKLIGTRMAEDSRIVFLGDPMQIDHPYLSKFRNGLVSLLKKAKQDDFLAGIVLHQTIRSEIAGWFEDNF